MRAQADQPSLADVARNKAAGKARRVVTNDEIPPSPEANRPANSGASKDAVAPAAPVTAQPAAKDVKPQSSSDHATKLQQLTADHEGLLKIIQSLEDKIAATTDDQRKSNLNQVIEHAKQALEENQHQIDSLKTAGPPVPASAPPK